MGDFYGNPYGIYDGYEGIGIVIEMLNTWVLLEDCSLVEVSGIGLCIEWELVGINK